MRHTIQLLLATGLLALSVASRSRGQVPVEQAWDQLPKYEYGQDMAPLLTIDRLVIQAMDSPAQRARVAARLAALLVDPGTSLAAKQYICFQLRQVGTSAEIPSLTPLLADRPTSQMARYAIASIPGAESLEALRNALDTLPDDLLLGVIHSVGDRRDTGSVARLEVLAQSERAAISPAAVIALGKIGDERSITFLTARAAGIGGPWPRDLSAALLRAGSALAGRGDTDRARSLLQSLAAKEQEPATRRAALEGLWKIMPPERRPETVSEWFLDGDPARNLVAARHLNDLSDRQLEALAQQLPQLAYEQSIALMDVIAARSQQDLLPLVLKMVRSDVLDVRLAGLRYLGAIPEASVVPVLIQQLAADERSAQVAQHSLARLPRELAGPALLEALQRADIRLGVIAVLKELKYYEAIDPLIAIASKNDPATYGPALDGLRAIADPDNYDIPRLVQLLLDTEPGAHRDEVEKTIAIVCEKLPAGQDRSQPVLRAVADRDRSDLPTCLPLLGRLGGAGALTTIEPLLDANQPEVADSAVRALCNWPSAEVADRLMRIVTGSSDNRHRRWALRAYVRVISLPSDRSPSDTLAMLQTAMKQARELEDRRLIITRTSIVRTMEAVNWLEKYLDDPSLAQAACASLVELAHHRELRNPHMDRFGPLLDRVAGISTDPDIVARAKRYRLGL